MTRIAPCEARQFKSKPKRYCVNAIMLSSYRITLEAFLRQIICCEMLECNVTSKRHESDIWAFYSKIVIALQGTEKLMIPFAKPHDCKRKMG